MAIIYEGGIAGKICANPECGWKPLSEFGATRLGDRLVGDGCKCRCRECARAQARAERAANLEHYRAIAREYAEAHQEHYRELKRSHRQAHPEKYHEALVRYRETHRDEINAKARARRQKDLEHYREIGRKSYERHAEERRQYSLEYFRVHPEKSVAATNRRRAQKLAAGGKHTEEEWLALKAFYNYRCLRCGKQEPDVQLTRDYVLPLTKGGTDFINNIQPLCACCNSRKNNKHIDYR